jgi:hypothetical protein
MENNGARPEDYEDATENKNCAVLPRLRPWQLTRPKFIPSVCCMTHNMRVVEVIACVVEASL